jgi:tRNA pseudouridine38-40 synthase
MRSLKLTLSYDGTDYAGWQVQADQRTIQGELERAIATITGESIRIVGSGRTDAGVHARGQVASFTTQSQLDCKVWIRALNANLPDDINVLQVERVATGFHAIRDAVRKRYRYMVRDDGIRDVFARRYYWQFSQSLNVEAMQTAALALVGRHDFASFQSSGADRGSTVRTIYELTIQRDENKGAITFEVEADGFLYNMVRAIVGTLVEVGRGAQELDWPAEVLATCDRKAGGPTAPPQGLFLVHVEYGE